MKLWNNKKLNKTIRSLHRDLGYLFIGLTFIYAFSGILLILKKDEQNPSYREIVIEKKASLNLTPNEFKIYFKNNFNDLPKLTRVIPVDDIYNIYVKGGLGEYYPYNGRLVIKTFKKIPLYKFVNDIHYNLGRRFSFLGIAFAVMLIFFAVSGAVMVKGKNGFKTRGVWIMLVGLVIPILLYFLM